MSFVGELKRRNLFKVGLAYAVVTWLTVQVVSVFAPALRLPEWVVSLVALLLILGLPVALLLAWVYELTPEGLRRTEDVPRTASITRVTGQRLNYVIIGALVLALAFVVVDSYVLTGNGGPSSVVASSSAPASGAGTESVESSSPAAASSSVEPASVAAGRLPNSVAVLPFRNMSPDPNNAFFAQGVHEEILNQLVKISALNVIARTSVLRYADTHMAIPDIARELRVEAVMEGSVRYAGDEVRITAQLIDSDTGAHLWSEAYQRGIEDIFAIQADIATSIANAVGAEFSLAERNAIETPLTSSVEAYELYLQARAAFSALLGMQSVNELLDRAIAIDPRFARALALKAYLYAISFTNSTQGTAIAAEGREALERQAREYAQRARAIDPSEPLAREALRSLNLVTWRWENDVETLTPAGGFEATSLWSISWMGRHADAVRIARRNAELSPNDASTHMLLGIVYAYAGDRAASTRSLNRSLELAPVNALARAWIAYNAIGTGDEELALAELRLAERMIGSNPALVFLPELAYAYSRIGRAEEAARFFAAIEARAAETDVGVGTWAMGYLAIGDEEEALRHLEAAVDKVRNHEPDQGHVQLMNLRMNFLADPRLEEPRFAELLSRIRGD